MTKPLNVIYRHKILLTWHQFPGMPITHIFTPNTYNMCFCHVTLPIIVVCYCLIHSARHGNYEEVKSRYKSFARAYTCVCVCFILWENFDSSLGWWQQRHIEYITLIEPMLFVRLRNTEWVKRPEIVRNPSQGTKLVLLCSYARKRH